ncbi:BQ5605_C003g01922 [Microbotryum silenes-dioicae]|uniref:BQ5605_C003g01922 protein n=1 Tax=Microbotryum silenes-dioicae TaxID=796604 RepID=A0A2X0M4F9_9BASI|nr:BQ5605_C003g01922 [Microbotryum silenes-dioicae]
MAMSTYPALAHHHHHYQSAQQQMHDAQSRTAAASAHSNSSAALDLDLSNLSLQDAPHRQHQHQHQHQQQHPHPALHNLHQQHFTSRSGFEEPSHQAPQSQRSARSHPNDFVHPLRSSQPTLFQPQPFGASNAPPDHPLHATTKLDTPRRRGVVKFFNSLKGFGFIVDNDPAALGGQEVFCHFSAISGKGGFRSLAEGEEVEYELVQGPKGFQATNLTGPQGESCGRTVVGDPKARMTKPPPYMPFAMPQFLSTDPYAPQGSVFAAAGSPYNLVYVPASVAVSPGQFNGYGHALAPGREGRHGASPFGSNYSFTPPGPMNGAPGASSHTNGVDSSRGGTGNDSDHYSSSLSEPTSYPSSRGGIGATPAAPFGVADYGKDNALFDRDSTRDQASNTANGSSFGFAPFSPASSSQLPLFDDGARSARAFDSHLIPSQAPGSSSNRPSSRGSLISASSVSGNVVSSLLPAPSNVFDALRPAPIGSRSRSPGTNHGTPLGNGSLSGNEWKSSAVLYTSASSSNEH